MTRKLRLAILVVGAAAVGIAMVWAVLYLPGFGGSWHPYRDHAAAAALAHGTANVVSSVNFDQRAFDTFGEESILVASVVGIAVILRPIAGERKKQRAAAGHVLNTTCNE
ncbi:hypothetical protein [Rathayibacter soli]|uniref:hypothetical protein n=1 Tax=Rathayibacter soli TaxID=3144168 RepID=UPI0027E45459|nr:hypothetical protein [Glaciibacter superstes]